MSDMNLLRLPELRKKIRMGRTTIYNKVKAGEMPAPVMLPGKRIAWREDEIDAWVLQLPRVESTRAAACARAPVKAAAVIAIAPAPIEHTYIRKGRPKEAQSEQLETTRNTRAVAQGRLFE